MMSLLEGFRAVYRIPSGRSFLHERVVAVMLVFVAAFPALGASALIVIGDAAILTMQYVSRGSEGAMHWNCTEVYQRFGAEWKIVHSHWSFTKPDLRTTGPAGT